MAEEGKGGGHGFVPAGAREDTRRVAIPGEPLDDTSDRGQKGMANAARVVRLRTRLMLLVELK